MNDQSMPRVEAQSTYIDFILDETGSMGSCKAATIKGFDDFIAEQKSIEGACYLTLTKFDSFGIKTPYVNLPLDLVPGLSFHPGQSTNLYDVVGKRVSEVLSQSRCGRSLVVIMTDGVDNASREFTVGAVRSLVANALMKGVSFLYFGAGPSARQVGLAMGIPENAVTVFETAHMGETMRTVSAETRAFRAA